LNRNLRLLMVVTPLLALGACTRDNPTDTTRTTGGALPAPATPAPATPAPATPLPNDNTSRNAEDQSGAGALTPIDQGSSEADLDTTQQIRKAIMDDDSLSIDAKNVKILTNGGVVTLRGPVRSESERAKLELAARKSVGSDRLIDELEIAPR
jgi:hyperosmotically inducible protein